MRTNNEFHYSKKFDCNLNTDLSFSLRTTKSLNRGSDSEGSRSGDGKSTTSKDLTALLAFPNTNTTSLNGVLTAESTSVAMDYTPLSNIYVLC